MIKEALSDVDREYYKTAVWPEGWEILLSYSEDVCGFSDAFYYYHNGKPVGERFVGANDDKSWDYYSELNDESTKDAIKYYDSEAAAFERKKNSDTKILLEVWRKWRKKWSDLPEGWNYELVLPWKEYGYFLCASDDLRNPILAVFYKDGKAFGACAFDNVGKKESAKPEYGYVLYTDDNKAPKKIEDECPF